MDYTTLSRRSFLTLSAAAAGAFLAEETGIGLAAELAAPLTGGMVSIAEMLDPINYDPGSTANEFVTNLSEKVCDKLAYLDRQHHYRAGLASRWRIAPNGKAITFFLRKDVQFHDGTPFNAKSVAFNLDRIAGSRGGEATFLLGPYKGTEIVDDHTARVHYSAPYAPGLDTFTTGFFQIVSPAAVNKYGKEFGQQVVGTGPFMWQKYTRDVGVTFVRNPRYKWGSPMFSNRGAPYLNKVSYKYAQDASVRAGLVRNGQVQILEGVPESQVANFKKARFTVIKKRAPGIPGVALINTNLPPTNDINVRKAILYGADRRAIAKVAWSSVWPIAHGPLSKSSWAYDPAMDKLYAYNPRKARQLLDQAGWKVGSDGIRVKNGQRLSVSLIFAIGTWQWTEIFQAQMQAIGIEIVIKQMEPLAAGQASAKGEANISPNLFTASDPNILSLVFSSRSIGLFNWTFYKSARLDSLLDVGVTQLNRTARKQTYWDIQKIIMDHALMLPLADTVVLYVVRPEVRGIVVDPRGVPMYLNSAWLGK